MSNGFKWEDEEFQIDSDPVSEKSPKDPEASFRENTSRPPGEPNAQAPSGSSSLAPASDAARTVQLALNFLNQIFGEKWAEKAAKQFKDSSQLTVKN